MPMFADRQRLIGSLLALAAALALGACGAPERSLPAAASTPAPPAATPLPSDQLYIYAGMKEGDEHLMTIDSLSGALLRDLPPGVVSPDWSTLYLAEQTGSQTSLRALDIASGRTLREISLDGAYRLPRLTADSLLGGLSPDGSWLALTTSVGSRQTQFIVIDTAFKQPARRATLDGTFAFDGLNNRGSTLFLTESLGANPDEQYQVRAYDLVSGRLDPNVIIDKLEGEKIMSGVRQGAVTSKSGGWLYSLYLEPGHGAFIHALPLDDNQGLAFCIDLPARDTSDSAKQARWSLLLSADQRTLYALNGALGLVAEYNIADGVPELRRDSRLFTTAADGPVGPLVAGSTISAITPDAATLYTVGAQGLLAIDTRDLKLRGRYLADWAVDGLALSPDGTRLYAASAARGKLVRIDPAAGTIAAEVPAATPPRGVLRVTH